MPSPIEIKFDESFGYTSFDEIDQQNNKNTPMNSINDPSAFYTVLEGETIFDIANKFNIDPMNLARMNGLRPPYRIVEGQKLQLPDDIDFQIGMENASKKAELEKKIIAAGSIKSQKEKDEIDTAFETSVLAPSSNKKPEGSQASTEAAILSVPKIVTSDKKGAKIKDNASEKKSGNIGTDNKMSRPIAGKVISQFGDLLDDIPNDGINIAAPKGTNVQSISSGTVIYTGNKLDEEFGNVVIVQHDNGLISSYAHLDKITVKNNEKISKGQIIGTVGKTGSVSRPQLHFEIMKNKKPVNPNKYFSM